MKYVIGFAFNGERVALIRKAKPAWQAGRLNGIGGKIETSDYTRPGYDADAAELAMAREFREETGVETRPDEWALKFIMHGGGWEAYVYATELDDARFRNLRTTTAEQVEIHTMTSLHHENCISNLYWMVPLARDKSGVKLPITVPFVHEDGTGT